ncbi:MAG: HAD family hydrolase [Anaerolineales bacterium]
MPLNLSQIQLICFDIDGTLADTDNVIVDHFAKRILFIKNFFPSVDIPSLARKIIMAVESPGNAFLYQLDRFGIDEWIHKIQKRLSPSGMTNLPFFTLIPGADETIKHLSNKYPIAILSARDEQSTRSFIQQMGFSDLIRIYASSETCPHTKPYPDPLLWISRQLEIDPKNILLVGDTTVDILTGKRAGAQTVGVLSGFGELAELVAAGADLILNDINMLAHILLL